MPLTSQQQALKRKVIDYGKRNGYSHADTQLAVDVLPSPARCRQAGITGREIGI